MKLLLFQTQVVIDCCRMDDDSPRFQEFAYLLTAHPPRIQIPDLFQIVRRKS